MFDIVIKNAIVVTMDPDCRPFLGMLAVQNEKIAYVGSELPEIQAMQIIDAEGKILFPGLINGHVHGDMTIFKGIGDDLTLKEQCDIYCKSNYFFDYLSEQDNYISRLYTYAEAVLSGTTYLVEFQYQSIGKRSIDAFVEIGLGGAVAETPGRYLNFPATKENFHYFEELLQYAKLSDIQMFLTGYAEEDFDPRQMEELYTFSQKYHIPVTQHFAETDWRMERIRNVYHSTPAKFMDKHNFLGRIPIIASHGVYIDEEDRKILKNYPFSVINSPVSEQKIADGIAPVPEMIQQGIPVGLGTDGAQWNNSEDMFREMKAIHLLHNGHNGIRTLTTRQSLELGTISGAKALGIDQRKGSLQVGKDGDFILIDTKNKLSMHPLRIDSHENIFSAILYEATGADVSDVFVKGRQVVQNGKLLTYNTEHLIRQAEDVGNRVLSHFSEEELSEIH